MRKETSFLASIIGLIALGVLAACGGKSDRPAATPTRPTAPVTQPTRSTTPPPATVNTLEDDRDDDSLLSLDDPDGILDRTLEDINADQNRAFLEDIRFDFDSAILSEQARATLDRHADWLSTRYPSVTLLIEGHCDERGTVEYNLALGERRANSVVSYLVSLGIAPGRLKTISYGKEFPLDPGHNEAAWARNRRGHFELTAK